MASGKLTADDLQRITQLAQDWGKIVCRRAFGDEGPGLEVDLDQMESLAHTAAQALLAGVLQEATSQQAQQLGPTQPCPTCGRDAPLTKEPRAVQVQGGEFLHQEPVGHCSTCRRDFFPSASSAEA